MTVKELRASLANYPEEAEVFLYNEVDESDGRLTKLTIDLPYYEDGYPLPCTPHYCQIDSEAEAYWSSFPKHPIVFLYAENILFDYEKERERKENM